MPTTLTYSGTTLTLPANVLWPDEFDWRPVQASVTYSLGGALLIDTGLKLAGRPMTLRCEWMTRSLALSLQAWAWLPNAVLTLSYRGVTYSVRFDHAGGNPMQADPVVEYVDPTAADFLDATLRFITV